MTKLEKIARKARSGDGLTEEEQEYVVEVLQKMAPLIEQTWEWLLPTFIQVVAIWLDALRKIEEEHQ